MSDWQPIETAPRKGEQVLVCRLVRRSRTRDIWIYHVAWYDARIAGWRIIAEKEPIVPPTHWQPLPDPPG